VRVLLQEEALSYINPGHDSQTNIDTYKGYEGH
jgi:hypothetical protein